MEWTLRSDIGTLLWIGFEGVVVTAELRRTLADEDAGGVTLFRRNLPVRGDETDLDLLRTLNADLHGCASQVFISVDQEGGRVQRVKAPLRHYPPMLDLEELEAVAAQTEARRLGFEMGTELADLGFDIDFAPVLDVHTNEANPIIGDRAFSRHPERVAELALGFASGLKKAGVIGCGKHFPGHGDTVTDSHLALPKLDHDMQRLREVELVPFQAAANAGVPMIMTAHVVFSAIDPSVPATMSHRVITGLLREELGFGGVIVSDDLDMKAVADNFGVGDAAIAAIEAGCDLLLLCRDPNHQEIVRTRLHREASQRPAFRARVAEAASRVRALRP